ncbi:LptA/OstA family protein [Caulobacter sp. S45]|uniref:LptA/OstA family protein n=1 Tax=Caulobacter sp. S45 TaxID=1641861 RepID=UPI00131AEE17|nr:LptA/OstA family protein [Caulobacter sp. S45]
MKAYLLSGAVLALTAASMALALPPPPASAPKGSHLAPAPAGGGASSAAPAAPASASSANCNAGLSTNCTSNSPVDITADGTEVFQPQRLVIYHGNVEAIHDDARLRTPEMRVFYKAKKTEPGQPVQAAATPGTLGENTGGIDHIEAAGPVYYITPTENARADHMLYVADTQLITMTGNVVLVNGKSVGTGDKFVMDRKTGHDQLYANATTGRVRTIIYTQQQPAAQPAAKPAAH